MSELGKVIVLIGLGIAAVGVILWALGKAGFHGLPGDVKYESEHVKVYVPIVTCIVLSILLSGAMWLWRWLSGR